ncbi:hypothetical protein OESDEN_00356 [Oesophagostomum dentatum]|uniref:Uncharacterized protein n=1 Tax=Oesophagostomum dentatum TaxID=61180 RepID=A0A0B1TQY9_OESDE|nr:hypothetical protein OESDEN_00356 [Oesophagostomum dentatum]
MFQIFDFFAIFITLIVYTVLSYFQGASMYITLPLLALFIFVVPLPFGVIGLLYQRENFLVAYNTRSSVVVLWSIVWMV